MEIDSIQWEKLFWCKLTHLCQYCLLFQLMFVNLLNVWNLYQVCWWCFLLQYLSFWDMLENLSVFLCFIEYQILLSTCFFVVLYWITEVPNPTMSSEYHLVVCLLHNDMDKTKCDLGIIFLSFMRIFVNIIIVCTKVVNATKTGVIIEHHGDYKAL